MYNFYPRSPRGERPELCAFDDSPEGISIHAPREGSDCARCPAATTASLFLSTLPARGATYILSDGRIALNKFLSTLPARGATVDELKELGKFDISIHAPREGSDLPSFSGSTG